MKVTYARAAPVFFCVVFTVWFLPSGRSFAQDTATGVLTSGRSITLKLGQKLPWSFDIVRHIKPEYPGSARTKGYHGSDVIRLTLDPKTGVVTSAVVKRSTGYKVLDESALEAFHGWRWKSGKWKQVDIPVTFTMQPAR